MASPEQEQPRTTNGDGEQAARPGAQAESERRVRAEGDGERRAREGARAMRSLATHFADLTREVSSLVRDETALARAEIAEDISQLKRGSGSLAIGGALAFGGLLFVLGAVATALAIVWPLWLASLVVGVVALILGGVGAIAARRWARPRNLSLDRTMESGRSIGRTAKEALR